MIPSSHCSLQHCKDTISTAITHSRTHSLTHSHTHSLTLTLSHSLSHSHTPAHTQSLTLTLTHSLTHSHTHSHTHSLTHSHTHSLSHSPLHDGLAHRSGSSEANFLDDLTVGQSLTHDSSCGKTESEEQGEATHPKHTREKQLPWIGLLAHSHLVANALT